MTMIVRVDLLRGRKVRDPSGRVVGRIRELLAEVARPGSGEYLVREFHLSGGGLLERLGAWRLGSVIADRVGRPGTTIVIGWRDLDLSDPEKPRLRRPIADAALGRPVER
jgi:hypothetical protein